jgi:hypothetical protein
MSGKLWDGNFMNRTDGFALNGAWDKMLAREWSSTEHGMFGIFN